MPRPKTKTNAQIKNDYAKKAYDDIRLQVKKGRKEQIKAYAEAQGMSLNGYINRLIEADMQRATETEQEQGD
ncbi:MAG: antitoxin [Ruminococcus sp.]|nr:antitoxin [Ruminococcus sp.]